MLNAQKLDYAGDGEVRLLLGITDVTDLRIGEKLKDDLLREKGILLQELQHRVANSLQIIASVLLQTARGVQSEETRHQLAIAHGRVMSVAAVQQQLAASRLGDVDLRGYFTALCKSLAASMIRDAEKLSIEVRADDSVVAAETSVSLGLIVTELVINALKHAFPGQRSGKIVVTYRSEATAWTLTVEDDGVGVPTDAASARPGLGTTLVEALTRQLHAEVTTRSGSPGTVVRVAHG